MGPSVAEHKMQNSTVDAPTTLVPKDVPHNYAAHVVMCIPMDCTNASSESQALNARSQCDTGYPVCLPLLIHWRGREMHHLGSPWCPHSQPLSVPAVPRQEEALFVGSAPRRNAHSSFEKVPPPPNTKTYRVLQRCEVDYLLHRNAVWFMPHVCVAEADAESDTTQTGRWTLDPISAFRFHTAMVGMLTRSSETPREPMSPVSDECACVLRSVLSSRVHLWIQVTYHPVATRAYLLLRQKGWRPSYVHHHPAWSNGSLRAVALFRVEREWKVRAHAARTAQSVAASQSSVQEESCTVASDGGTTPSHPATGHMNTDEAPPQTVMYEREVRYCVAVASHSDVLLVMNQLHSQILPCFEKANRLGEGTSCLPSATRHRLDLEARALPVLIAVVDITSDVNQCTRIPCTACLILVHVGEEKGEGRV